MHLSYKPSLWPQSHAQIVPDSQNIQEGDQISRKGVFFKKPSNSSLLGSCALNLTVFLQCKSLLPDPHCWEATLSPVTPSSGNLLPAPLCRVLLFILLNAPPLSWQKTLPVPPGRFSVSQEVLQWPCDTAGNVARTWGEDTSDNVLSAPVPPTDPSLDGLTSSHTHIQPLTSAVSQKQRRKTLVGCDSPFIVNSRRHTRTAIDGAREPRPAQCKPTRAQWWWWWCRLVGGDAVSVWLRMYYRGGLVLM